MLRNIAALALAATAVVGLTPPADAGTMTYDQFSGFGQRWAGQWRTSGTSRGQWAWEPVSGGAAPGAVAHIRWGDPWGPGTLNPNPPADYERFERSDDGEWLLVDGYGNNELGFLPQRVTEEYISDLDCKTNRRALPPVEDGKQHYVKWDVTGAPYCLEAYGVIDLPDSYGPDVRFYHRQAWWPPSGPWCSNPYFTNQVCMKQFESWWDDNPVNGNTPGGPLVEVQNRDQMFAQGKGQAYWIHSYRTTPNWHADGNSYWRY